MTKSRQAARCRMSLTASLLLLGVAPVVAVDASGRAVAANEPPTPRQARLPQNNSAGSISANVFGVLPGLRISHAADVTGTITAGGPAQTVTISTPGDKARITFDGVANQRVSLNLTNVSFSASYVSIQKPNGAGDLISPTLVFSSGKFIDVATLPTTGTYTIYVDPYSSGTGSMTMTLYDVPADLSGPITPGGTAVTGSTTTPGQNARYTFSGTQGQRISLSIAGVTLAPSGSAGVVSILKPNGTTLASSGVVTSSGWIDTQTLPTSGQYTVLVDPSAAATGSTTVTLYDVPPDVSGSVTPSGTGGVSAPATTTPGQNARITFAGTQGQRVSLNVTGVNVPNSYEIVSILKPDGSTLAGSGVVTTSGWIDTQTLPTSGTYTLLVDPYREATSTSTLTAYAVPDDFAGALPATEDAAEVETTVPGQDARLTFSGTAGSTVYIPRGGITTPLSQVKILKPDGSFLSGTPVVSAADGTQSATLPVTGTYTVLVDGYRDAVGEMTLAVSDEDALIGGLSEEQPDLSLEEPDVPAAPQPISPSGPLAPGNYSTEVWESSEVGNDRGLEVVSSTASGTFSVTGIIKAESTDAPIEGATVNIAAGATSVTATTDANGAFAIANIPAGSTQTTVTPPSPWGTYQSTNWAPSADTTYERTINLTAEPQTEDDTADEVLLSQTAEEAGATDHYSQTRVPPTIDVRILNLYPVGDPLRRNCAPLPGEPGKFDQSPPRPIVTYLFDYYVLRVAHQEFGAYNFNQVGTKANFAVIQNFAWYHKALGGLWDIENSTRHQCFREQKVVDRRWRQWLRDVLNERVAKPSNRLLETLFNAGAPPKKCSDPDFPAGGPIASQYVLAGRGELNCPQETDWREVVKYYYTPTPQVKGGARPFLPTTRAYHLPDDRLRITFNSVFKDGNTYHNVAWRFRVFQKRNGNWVPFKDVKPARYRSPVPTHRDLTAQEAQGTHRYLVRACNPVGCSQAAKVRDADTGDLDITG